MKSAKAAVKVSVLIITYNHEAFIAQALEGALSQKANFKYEIVVGEDCSTDNTRSIIEKYQAGRPDEIRLLGSERNLGLSLNFAQILKACQGEFVAILDGDDYWTDPHKLQKQVDYLEAHPGCSICFHSFTKVFDHSEQEPFVVEPPEKKAFYTLEDLLLGCIIKTSTVMFRNYLLGELPAWFFSAYMVDWPLFVLLTQHGDAGYVDEVMAVYRIHGYGVWSGIDPVKQYQITLRTLNIFIANLGQEYLELTHRSKDFYIDNVLPGTISNLVNQEGSFRTVIRKTRNILSTWPSDLALTSRAQRLIWGCILSDYFFLSYKKRDPAGTVLSFILMIFLLPERLKNRGVYSILLQSLLGQSTWKKLTPIRSKLLN